MPAVLGCRDRESVVAASPERETGMKARIRGTLADAMISYRPARCLCAGLFAALWWTSALAEAEAPQTGAPAHSAFRDPEDGWFDLSGFIDHSYGFAPIAIPITEPAVGYGAAAALVFIDKQKNGDSTAYAPPNLTAVGGLATEDGSWGVFGLDSRHWLDDRLQTIVAIGYINLHLDYYGLGEGSRLRDHPVAYQLTPFGGKAQIRYRLGQTRAKIGLAYSLATTRIEFDPASDTAGLPAAEQNSRLGGLTPAFNYDSRNSLFTPTRGIYAETRLGVYSKLLGSDTEYQMADLVFIGYYPLHSRVTVGTRGSAGASSKDTPFYLRPFVYMRGVAAMRYQGEQVAQIEAEVRYQFWKRFSVVGFGGAGQAWSDSDAGASNESVAAVGTGVCYELARKYGLHVGVDAAWGPDQPAFYVQFGNAWLKL